MRLWFLGNGPFAASCLEHLTKELSFLRILTAPPRPAGRGLHLRPTPVDEAARKAGYTPTHSFRLSAEPAIIQALEDEHPDALVVIDFSQFIRFPFLDTPPWGCLNVHPSLLPLYRGAAPVPRALMDGVTEMGVTVFRLVAEMDGGPICAQERFPVPPGATSGEMLESLAKRGSQMLVDVLQSRQLGVCAEYAQNSLHATYAPKILPGEALIDWETTALALEHRVRALNPAPGAYALLENGRRLKIWKAFSQEGHGAPGSVVGEKNGFPLVACASGALALEEVQAEGRSRTDGAAWWRGQPGGEQAVVFRRTACR